MAGRRKLWFSNSSHCPKHGNACGRVLCALTSMNMPPFYANRAILASPPGGKSDGWLTSVNGFNGKAFTSKR
jgi:hypothetical protein